MNVTEGNGEQVCENKKTGCDQLSKMFLNFFLPVVISHLSLSVVTFLLQPAILQSVFFLTGKNRHIRNTNDRTYTFKYNGAQEQRGLKDGHCPVFDIGPLDGRSPFPYFIYSCQSRA